jgi:hypothetical protein
MKKLNINITNIISSNSHPKYIAMSQPISNKELKQKIAQKNKANALLQKMMFDSGPDTGSDIGAGTNNTSSCTSEKYAKISVSGKGRTGTSDFTKGKCCFARPCTVGWKSQNQPLGKGAGNRTPL